MKREPALVAGIVASVVVALAAKYNIVIDEASVAEVLAPLVTSIITRFFVTPVAKVQGVEPGV